MAKNICSLLISQLIVVFGIPQITNGQPGTYGYDPVEERQKRTIALDNRLFWTELDTTLVSNEFELFSKIPLDYSSLKPSQEGMLVFILLFSPTGELLDYGIQAKPDGVKDLSPFISLLTKIQLRTPEGRNPFTREFAEKVGKNFYYFLFWPIYRHLPYGKPILDESYAKYYNYFVLRSNKGSSDFNRLVQVDSPAEALKFNSWKNKIAFPEYGLEREIKGKVSFEVVVDTLSKVIKHRMLPETHAVYVYVIMEKLYQLRFTPAI